MRALPVVVAGLVWLTGCATPGIIPARIEDIVDVRWHWVAAMSADALTQRPDPARHWFETGATGAIIVQADCNSGVGRRPGIDGLRFGPIALTRRFCGERSLDTVFATALSVVTDAGLDAGLLRLTGGASTLLFTRTLDAPLQRYLCPSGPIDILWSADAAWMVTPGQSRRLERAEPREASRYADSTMTVERAGDSLLLLERAAGTRSRCSLASE
jgi:heat shock protein HslJ